MQPISEKQRRHSRVTRQHLKLEVHAAALSSNRVSAIDVSAGGLLVLVETSHRDGRNIGAADLFNGNEHCRCALEVQRVAAGQDGFSYVAVRPVFHAREDREAFERWVANAESAKARGSPFAGLPSLAPAIARWAARLLGALAALALALSQLGPLVHAAARLLGLVRPISTLGLALAFVEVSVGAVFLAVAFKLLRDYVQGKLPPIGTVLRQALAVLLPILLLATIVLLCVVAWTILMGTWS